MRAFQRIAMTAAVAALLGGCALLGGGKAPKILYTLTPSAEAPAAARSAAVGETVTVRTPVVPKELRSIRVPVQVSAVQVQYVEDLQWVDYPARLFQGLVEEVVRRNTGRVVLSPDQSTLDPGLVVSGELNKFGYDAQTGMAVIQYDVSLATQGGSRVENRRFEAMLPADGTAATVAPALNQGANQVALEVARWITG